MTLLWAVLFSVAATVILQDMAARVGLAGRRGLAEAIRDSLDNRRIRVGALGLITVTILVGNAAFQTGNLIGASLGLSLLSGLPQEALALVVGGLAAGLLLTGTYQTIQNALVCLVGLMSIVFCAVAGLTAPDIGDLIAGVLIPRLPPGSLLTVLALIGTTFVSYNLFLHASTALERWPDASRNDENIRESRRIRCSRWSSAASSRRQSSSPPHRSSDRERTRRTPPRSPNAWNRSSVAPRRSSSASGSSRPG